MNITNKLYNAMYVSVESEVALMDHVSFTKEVRESNFSSVPFRRAYNYCYEFKVRYNAVVEEDQRDSMKKQILRAMKHDLFGEIRDELLELSKLCYDEGVHNRKLLGRIGDLIEEIS